MSSAELKLLVDVGVGTGVEEGLREQGYDTKSVRSIDPRMEDSDIIRVAVSEGRMVLTMDKDFGELVFHSGVSHSGVLLLRLDDATSEEKRRVVKSVLETYADRMIGCFCVFKNDKLRIRSQPPRNVR